MGKFDIVGLQMLLHDDVIKYNFCGTGRLCGEFNGHRSLTKAGDAELWWVL